MSNILAYPQFMGRLGNNLFQIAATASYALKHNIEWGIPKGYIEPGFQVYQVDQFMPDLPSHEGVHFKRYDEPNYDYTEIPFFPEGVRLVGYFQSIKYFEQHQNEIRYIIGLPIVDGYRDYCGIHARRGDYVLLDSHFPPVTVEYFKQAIPIMLDNGYKKFLVCSDGMEWCEEMLPANFPSIHFEFIKGLTEWRDMALMASCGANIIANSSFSWWAAFLNDYPQKIVVSPHNSSYYGPDMGVVKDAIARGVEPCRDLIPDSWIKIKFR